MLYNHIYIFSGLGADERVFQKLDFSGLLITHIKWIKPENNERIEQYAKRISASITIEKPIIIGLSFGGMIAVEVAKQIETEKVILISSAKTKNEIPFFYRIAGKLRIHKLFPASLLKRSNFFVSWLFGANSDLEKKSLLKNILNETNPIFLKWAIDAIVRWKNQTIPKNITHIHGTNDHVLPIRFVHCDMKIKDGGHFMVLNKAQEITKIIRTLI